jgi:predicted DNA-binding transcriptional regulator AlpA
MQHKAASHRAEVPSALIHFDVLPDSAEVRVPVVAALYGCSVATVWRRVRNGDLPAPVRRAGITSWRVGELRRAKA